MPHIPVATYKDGTIELLHKSDFFGVGLASSTKGIELCILLDFGQRKIFMCVDTFDIVCVCNILLLVDGTRAVRWSVIDDSHDSLQYWRLGTVREPGTTWRVCRLDWSHHLIEVRSTVIFKPQTWFPRMAETQLSNLRLLTRHGGLRCLGVESDTAELYLVVTRLLVIPQTIPRIPRRAPTLPRTVLPGQWTV